MYKYISQYHQVKCKNKETKKVDQICSKQFLHGAFGVMNRKPGPCPRGISKHGQKLTKPHTGCPCPVSSPLPVMTAAPEPMGQMCIKQLEQTGNSRRIFLGKYHIQTISSSLRMSNRNCKMLYSVRGDKCSNQVI